ncbi:hypothetical protein NWF35_02920 [Polycladomyces subterraneus]|uniref:Uncharacterized protein n=1 Tax=Polycladomyces subterraneus TaxID=1016997 RepID=A0ABT8IKG0_9BACL|nr:hypothetical protein [Polycladomyces subterraneus]MDN4592877.1 hypothetical protein [Polycladomyces subterraneus]
MRRSIWYTFGDKHCQHLILPLGLNSRFIDREWDVKTLGEHALSINSPLVLRVRILHEMGIDADHQKRPLHPHSDHIILPDDINPGLDHHAAISRSDPAHHPSAPWKIFN